MLWGEREKRKGIWQVGGVRREDTPNFSQHNRLKRFKDEEALIFSDCCLYDRSTEAKMQRTTANFVSNSRRTVQISGTRSGSLASIERMKIFLSLLFLFSFSISQAVAVDGKAVYAQCSGCHGAKGQGTMLGPALKGLYQRGKLKSGKQISDLNVKLVVQKGQGNMPGFPQIDGADWAGLLDYLKKL